MLLACGSYPSRAHTHAYDATLASEHDVDPQREPARALSLFRKFRHLLPAVDADAQDDVLATLDYVLGLEGGLTGCTAAGGHWPVMCQFAGDAVGG